MSQPLIQKPITSASGREQRVLDAVVASYLHGISVRHRPAEAVPRVQS